MRVTLFVLLLSCAGALVTDASRTPAVRQSLSARQPLPACVHCAAARASAGPLRLRGGLSDELKMALAMLLPTTLLYFLLDPIFDYVAKKPEAYQRQ